MVTESLAAVLWHRAATAAARLSGIWGNESVSQGWAPLALESGSQRNEVRRK